MTECTTTRVALADLPATSGVRPEPFDCPEGLVPGLNGQPYAGEPIPWQGFSLRRPSEEHGRIAQRKSARLTSEKS
jgi:hypothetical protein